MKRLRIRLSQKRILNNYRRKPVETKLDLGKIKTQLNRLKNKQYPNKPKTSEDMAAELKKPETREMFGKTLDGQRIFYIDSVVRKQLS